MLKPDFDLKLALTEDKKKDIFLAVYHVFTGKIEHGLYSNLKFKEAAEQLIPEFCDRIKLLSVYPIIVENARKKLILKKTITLFDFLIIAMKMVGFKMIDKPFRYRLNHEDILQLFPVLSQYSEYGNQWKIDVVNALQEDNVYFVEFLNKKNIEDIEVFTLFYKRLIRETMINDKVNDKLSYNLIHTPDQHEIKETINYFHSKIKKYDNIC